MSFINRCKEINRTKIRRAYGATGYEIVAIPGRQRKGQTEDRRQVQR